MANVQVTQAQLLIAIASLTRGFTLPATNGNQLGIFSGPGNQLQIPINSNNPQGVNNQQLGQNLSITADGNYIYIQQNVGDAAIGL